MVEFCGLSKSSLDANGRIRLCPQLQKDFLRHDEAEIILHCYPEGALTIYPVSTWEAIRARDLEQKDLAAHSVVYRRELRSFGALTHRDKLTNQGRVTIPQMFRELCKLESGKELMVAGCEIGVELWNPELWQQEFIKINEHNLTKGQNEMQNDLNAGEISND